MHDMSDNTKGLIISLLQMLTTVPYSYKHIPVAYDL